MYSYLDSLLAKAKKKIRTEFNRMGVMGFDSLNVVNTKKITKEMCISFIKDYYKSNPIALVIFSIFALVALWFFTKNIVIVAILAALALVAIVFIIYITNKKVNNIIVNVRIRFV